MEVETRGADHADPSPRAMEFEGHASDGVHIQNRTSKYTEMTTFSDLLVERDSTASVCVNNTGVDLQEREGEGEKLRTGHSQCENHSGQSYRTLDGCVDHHQGANDCLSQHHDRRPSEDINDCIQPSSMTNLCDAPAQCAVAGSSDVTALQTTNLDTSNDDHVFYRADSHRTKWEEAAIYVQEGEDNEKFVHHPTDRHSKLAFKILHHSAYYITHLIVTILLMLLALVENYPTPRDGSQISDQAQRAIFLVSTVLELLFLTFLVLHTILKFIWYGPRNFIKSKRSILITIVLVVLFLEIIVVLARQRSHLRITRALRPIFFIDNVLMDEVRRELRDIRKSLKPIIDVLVLLLFFVLMFALLGYYIFAEVDPSYYDSFQMSFVSLYILMTTANNPDVMLESYLERPASVIFFIIYLIITVYFISNMLLAVVYSSFSDAAVTKFKKLYLHKSRV